MFHTILACPYCGKDLMKGEQKRYGTILDHVEDPNREWFPLRDTWVCSCEESKGVFWDNTGMFYSDHYVKEEQNAFKKCVK